MRHGSQSGVAIVILMVMLAVALILMAAAAPAWKYVAKNEREQELIFRGDQIARAIEAYQQKNANTYPTSLELLTKGRQLRRLYKDPMTRDGKWRLIRQGEPLVPPTTTAGGRARPTPGPTPRPTLAGDAGGIGPIVGVASRSSEPSLRVLNVNGIPRTRYDEWYFVAGQTRFVGRPPVLPVRGGRPPGANPGGAPYGTPQATPQTTPQEAPIE
jgi:type II secretory pathway pseudopilin PulG